MKATLRDHYRWLCLAAGLAGLTQPLAGQDILTTPSRGGGLNTNAPMIHIDLFYDYAANQMQATLDTSKGVPKLVPLPAGCTFDCRSNYAVLTGKAYNFQYAWNPGGIFTNPPGAALWIECVSASPGLETYDGPGNKMISPPRTYAPIFGTSGSSTKWSWYGAMAHNTYAVLNPSNSVASAQYHIYFGDAQTGARDAYASYGDATVTLTWAVDPVTIVQTARGGGLNTNAPMIHVDLFYDYGANQMQATLDTSKGVPKLVPLPAGYIFDSRSNYAVLNGKAYNFQYAWNPGGIFTNPAGAALWIDCVSASPGLETYDGPGNKMISPPRTYAPIFGTSGSSTKWAWYGSMAHNSYAILNPTNSLVSAQYHLYFGDAVTGARDAFAGYGDATVTLTWMVDLPLPPLFQFGALDPASGSQLCFLNADQFVTNSMAVVNCRYTNSGPCAGQFEGPIRLRAVPATAANGGPETNAAALGSCLALELVSLAGPPGATLGLWETGQSAPSFTMNTGEAPAANRLLLSQSQGGPATDPYGCVEGRRVTLSQPGLYCLSFRAVDISTNGIGGAPVLSPSPVYRVFFQAGLRINALSPQGSGVTASFGGDAGKTFYLERAATLDPTAAWQTVAGPLTGSSRLQSLTDPQGAVSAAFFRLRATTP